MDIYKFDDWDAVVFSDSTVLKNSNPDAAQLVLKERTDVLFPEAANNMEGANALKDALTVIQEDAKDSSYIPDVNSVQEFGIQSGAEDIVREILNRYVQVCRAMDEAGLRFGPGVQYNYQGFSEDGVEVTLGNYGLFHATLIAAANDRIFRYALIGEGKGVLGSRHGFFVNPPATTAVTSTSDGRILFVERGNTAEYPHMLHQVAAGHHPPTEDEIVDLQSLVARQITTETGVKGEDIEDFTFHGVAFSSGKDFPGTEKVELLTSVRLSVTDAEVAIALKEHAADRWETNRLYSIHRDNLGDLLTNTGDRGNMDDGFRGARAFDGEKLTPKLLRDSNSASYWVPVALAALKMDMDSYE